MSISWKTFQVAELIRDGVLVVGDGYRAKNEELGNSGLPFARCGNINNGFHLDDAERYPIENLKRVGTKVSEPGDVVFTSKGTVGRFAFVGEATQRFVYSPQLCYWRVANASVIDSKFLYYWMTSREFFEQYSGVSQQTDMAAYVSLQDQRRMKITLPPLSEQRATASILGILDDKIELNHKMNETLEAIARARFQSWFIDFDPVRAKMGGRDPVGMDGETAALFPDTFENSASVEIPKGWHHDTIGSLTRVVGGSTPSTTRPQYWETGTHYWATPRDLSRLSNPVLLETERQITDAGVQQISSGLLPVGTVLLSSRAPIGYLAITEVPTAINQGFIALICDGRLPNHYVLQWLVENMAVIKGRANGTTFQEISKSNFRPISVIVPPREVLNAFTAEAEPLHNKLVANLRESKQLAGIRDMLLPRLMSGEVRVRDPERNLETIG